MNSLLSIPKVLRNTKVLVTGASGFVGSHLTRSLLSDGCSVIACVRPQSNHSRLDGLKGDLEILPLDLGSCRAYDLIKMNLNPKIIFHCGAYGIVSGQNDPEIIKAVNVRGTEAMLEFAKTIGVSRFVHCGSCFEYSSGAGLREDMPLNPVSDYGQSKKSAGELVQKFWHDHKLAVVTLRLFTVYGPGEDRGRLVSSVIDAIIHRKSLKLTEGRQTRDFVFIDDVINACYLAAIGKNILGEVFNIATGVETSVKDMVYKIIGLMNSDLAPQFGALLNRPQEYWRLSGDPFKSDCYLNWRFQTRLEEGLRKTIAWSLAHRRI